VKKDIKALSCSFSRYCVAMEKARNLYCITKIHGHLGNYSMHVMVRLLRFAYMKCVKSFSFFSSCYNCKVGTLPHPVISTITAGIVGTGIYR
jgi:hypothetical protein